MSDVRSTRPQITNTDRTDELFADWQAAFSETLDLATTAMANGVLESASPQTWVSEKLQAQETLQGIVRFAIDKAYSEGFRDGEGSVI